MKVNRGLGKGLSALFSETEEDYGKSLIFNEQPEEKGEGVTEIKISDIFANPHQPRKVFDQTALKELADSISKHGVIMPIIVNQSGDKYMIIAGERRFRASKIAGLEKVPVIIKKYNELFGYKKEILEVFKKIKDESDCTLNITIFNTEGRAELLKKYTELKNNPKYLKNS